ncbi:universal stress protein [Streptomyces sp. NPDC005435]|uniref:universal stress protein n=1 Tax=Streptomyces sp. NPDC005435 TaxID=3154464 RepID=UPI003453E71C
MTLPLVVGVDGSDSSLAAVDWAVDEAARHGLPLKLLYGSLWERYEGGLPAPGGDSPSEQAPAEHIVASAAERARRRDPDVKVTTEIVPQEGADALVRAGDDAFAVVTGARGRGPLTAMLLGSVGLAVAGRASCPVIVVRGDRAGLAGEHERILLGLGGADTGTRALEFAYREAQTRGCGLDVVRAWRRPVHDRSGAGYEERAAALLAASVEAPSAGFPRVRTYPAVVEGPAAKVLVDRSAAADLVIVGARHRTERFGLQLGRVGHALLHHAACPVVVVPERP